MNYKNKIMPENINSGTVQTVTFETVVRCTFGKRIEMRTQREISNAINVLMQKKDSLPEYDMFGNNTHAELEAIIKVIEENITDVADTLSMDESVWSSAELGCDWLNGKIEISEIIE